MISAAPRFNFFLGAAAQHLIPNLSEGCSPVFPKLETKVAFINCFSQIVHLEKLIHDLQCELRDISIYNTSV